MDSRQNRQQNIRLGNTYDTLFQPENTLQTRSHYNYDITATGIKHLSSNVSEWCIDPVIHKIIHAAATTNTSPIFYEITNVQQHLDNHVLRSAFVS